LINGKHHADDKTVLDGGFNRILSMLAACTKSDHDQKAEQEKSATSHDKAEILPYLDIQESKAKYALPFCEKKNCIDIDIQSIQTKDSWLNSWVEQKLAYVVQAQIGQNQKINLQKAINAYVAKSDTWQDQYSKIRLMSSISPRESLRSVMNMYYCKLA
jgi:hypothetical protein